MEQNEVTEKLVNKAGKLGYSVQVQQDIRQARENGLIEFSVGETKSFRSPVDAGNFTVDYQLNFAPGKDQSTTYLQTIEALLTRDIPIIHASIDGVNTRDTERLILQNPLLNGGQQLPEDYVNKLRDQMQWALEHAPETFAALLVKYNPPVQLTIPESVTKMAVEFQANQNKYNIYSSYFNLTALEIANTLQGRHVRKSLFRTNSAEQQNARAPQNAEEALQKSNLDNASTEADSLSAKQSGKNNTFKTWLLADFESPRRRDGAAEIKLLGDFDVMQVIKQFHFRELVNMYDRSRVADFVEKGSLMLFNNLNDKGEPQVLLQANGIYKGADMFKLDGEPIKNHRAYLKERHVEVGTYVELKRGPQVVDEQQKKTPESGQQRTQRMNDLRNQAIAAGSKAAAQKSGDRKANDNHKARFSEHGQSSSTTVRHTGNRKPRTVQSNTAHKGQKR
jgi:hypothetical protein